MGKAVRIIARTPYSVHARACYRVVINTTGWWHAATPIYPYVLRTLCEHFTLPALPLCHAFLPISFAAIDMLQVMATMLGQTMG